MKEGSKAATLVKNAIEEQLVGSGSHIGYRRIHKSLNSQGLIHFDDVR